MDRHRHNLGSLVCGAITSIHREIQPDSMFRQDPQETNLWLKELMRRFETGDRYLAYKVLNATLRALRDRIGPENAAHLLPMLIHGFYYEGWHMAATNGQ
ncbi:DUF2267 domain-containing protein [Hyphomicrobium sp. DY-1]|uniref:DUF2267 domain-containing protein n=1 Tax=Hyphomicrobium sp. DY-1 TaxID=3075650 RepID=UPI0039C0536C